MRLTRTARFALLLGALVAASGFIWLPVPLHLAQDALAERGPGFTVAGAARLRWATGELRVTDAQVAWNGAELGRADWVGVRLDLRPWRARALPVARVEIAGAQVTLDEPSLRALIGPEQPPEEDFSAFEVRVRDAGGSFRLADGSLLSFRGGNARIAGTFDANGRFHVGVEAEARLTDPIPTRLEVRVQADPVGETWEASVRAQVADLPPLDRLGLPAAGTSWVHATADLRAYLTPDLWLVDGSAEARGLRQAQLPCLVDALRVRLAGDARSELRASAELATPRGRLQGEAWLTRAPQPPTSSPLAGWSLDALAQLSDLPLDAALRDDLAAAFPGSEKTLVALGLSGAAAAQVRVRADLAAGAPLPRMCALAAPAGLGLDYAGFTDELTGESFSFRLPAAVTGGQVAWSDDTILFRAAAVVGEADGDPHAPSPAAPAQVEASGAVLLVPDAARVELDLSGSNLVPGPRIGAALAANPPLEHLWEDLGAPAGGTADLRLRVRPAAATHRLRVLVRAQDVRMTPPLLGLEVLADQAEVDVAEGAIGIRGHARVAGLSADLEAQLRAVAGDPTAFVWACRAAGTGVPEPAALERIATVAPDFALCQELSVQGVATWTAGLRFVSGEGGALLGAPSWQAEIELASGALRWPQHALEVDALEVRGGAVGGAGGAAVQVASAQGVWSGGRMLATASATVPAGGGALPGHLAGSVFGAQVADAQVRETLAPLGARSWTRGIVLGGVFSANVDMPLAAPERALARLDLAPLSILLPEGTLKHAARRAAAKFEISGRIFASAGQLGTTGLQLDGPDVDLELRECAGHFDPSGLHLTGRTVSARGMRLRPPLGLVAPQRVLDSLDLIGLDGELAPRDLMFELDVPSAGSPVLRSRGTVDLRDFQLSGPPPIEDGSGRIECVDFIWRGPEDFEGRFLLSDGGARVAGVGMEAARAELALKADRIVVTRFAAAALGGHASTEWLDADGGAHRGGFELGLAGKAQVRAEFRFEDFELERLGEELGFRGPLAGKLSGEVAIRSPGPSPVDYKGEVSLRIRDGVLGTVPVLAQLWRLLGIDAPTFSRGELRMSFLGAGRMLVENFSLQHPLLEVTGERTLTIDSYLSLKVTVRTLGFFGRLPLIKDLLDFLVEHDVYGPAAAPRLRQRGFGKLLAGDVDRVPFPLWMPKVQRPDWRKSPALPVTGPALRTPSLPHP